VVAMTAAMKSARCYGPCAAKVTHTKRCRPGRPLCRWRRLVRWGICWSCGAYHFPHRLGGGLCGKPEAIYAEMERPMRKGVHL
jgi:hypothetical protein